MPSLTLYSDKHFTSPYAMSVFVTLTEKGIPFEHATVDLDAGAHHEAPYRDMTLTGRVPTLVHGELVLNESSAIVEYLEEVFPAPQYAAVLPKDVQARARARQVQAWLRSDLQGLRAERSTAVIFQGARKSALTANGQAIADRLVRIAGRLVNGPNLFGEWSIADAELALMLNRLVMHGDPVPAALADYATLQFQRPSVQKWMDLPHGV